MSGNCAKPGGGSVADALPPCSVGPVEFGVQPANASAETATQTNTRNEPFISIELLYHADYGLELVVIRFRQ